MGMEELGIDERRKAKTGATVAPVFGGTRQLPLLAALLLPALRCFLCHLVYPPLRVGFVREERSPYRSAAAIRHVGGASIRRSSLRLTSEGLCLSDFPTRSLARRLAPSAWPGPFALRPPGGAGPK